MKTKSNYQKSIERKAKAYDTLKKLVRIECYKGWCGFEKGYKLHISGCGVENIYTPITKEQYIILK